MKDSTIIPLEPDNQKALDKILQAGGSAKVMLQGSDAVFMMKKAEKGGDYELFKVTSEATNETMRSALENLKDLIKP